MPKSKPPRGPRTAPPTTNSSDGAAATRDTTLHVASASEAPDRERWRALGYVVVRGLFSAEELAQVRRWAEELPSLEGPIQTVERVGGVSAPNRTEAFADHHPELSAFLRAGPLPRFVERLAGEPVALFKEKINYKAPGGSGGYTPHQDAYSSAAAGLGNLSAPASTANLSWAEQFYVCMISVDASDASNGCPTVAPGWHERGLFKHTLPPYRFAEGDSPSHANIPRAAWLPVPMQAGDVLVYNQYMPHTSAPNSSDRWRRALFGVYNAASRGADLRAAYYESARREGGRWGTTASHPDGGPTLTVGVDGTGEPVDEQRGVLGYDPAFKRTRWLVV